MVAKFELPKLPFAMSALEPYISKETISFHYKKHHQSYIDSLNKLLRDPKNEKYNNKSLIEIIRSSNQSIFNMAAQHWNHSFYWDSMSKPDETQISPELKNKINKTFGSLAKLKSSFNEMAVKHFGSGWTWIVLDDAGKMLIKTTSDAYTPVQEPRLAPLAVCDIWEHAYYIDYRNERKEYLDAWWQCVNWTRISERYLAARRVFRLSLG